jgi:hypothetical protein
VLGKTRTLGVHLHERGVEMEMSGAGCGTRTPEGRGSTKTTRYDPSTRVSLECQTLVRLFLDPAVSASTRNGLLRAFEPMCSRAGVMQKG